MLRQFPPGKWVPLVQTVEDGSENAEFLTRVQLSNTTQVQVMPHGTTNLSHMHN